MWQRVREPLGDRGAYQTGQLHRFGLVVIQFEDTSEEPRDSYVRFVKRRGSLTSRFGQSYALVRAVVLTSDVSVDDVGDPLSVE